MLKHVPQRALRCGPTLQPGQRPIPTVRHIRRIPPILPLIRYVYRMDHLPRRHVGSAGVVPGHVGTRRGLGLRPASLVLGHSIPEVRGVAGGVGGDLVDALGTAVAKAGKWTLANQWGRIQRGRWKAVNRQPCQQQRLPTPLHARRGDLGRRPQRPKKRPSRPSTRFLARPMTGPAARGAEPHAAPALQGAAGPGVGAGALPSNGPLARQRERADRAITGRHVVGGGQGFAEGVPRVAGRFQPGTTAARARHEIALAAGHNESVAGKKKPVALRAPILHFIFSPLFSVARPPRCPHREPGIHPRPSEGLPSGTEWPRTSEFVVP